MANGDIIVRHEPHPLYTLALECQSRRQRFGSAKTHAGRDVYGPSMGGALYITEAGVVVADPFGTHITTWASIAEIRWGEPGTDMRAGRPPGVYQDGKRWVIQPEPELVGFYGADGRISLAFDDEAGASATLATETAAAMKARAALLG